MKVKGMILVGALLVGLAACQPSEENDCEWELEQVAYITGSAPRPAPPRHREVKVPGAKPPVKMPVVEAPKPTSKPPKGKVWEYDCD